MTSNSLLLKIAIEIVGLPIENGDFPYVSLPEGIYIYNRLEPAAELLVRNLPLENMPRTTCPMRRACRSQSHGGKARHTKLLPVRRNSCRDPPRPKREHNVRMLLIRKNMS